MSPLAALSGLAGATPHPSASAVLPELRHRLDEVARRVPPGARPVRAPKDVLTRVLACERHHTATAGERGARSLSEPVVRGLVLDRLLHHHVHGEPTSLRSLLVADGALLAERDDDVLAWLDDPGERERRDRIGDDAAGFAAALRRWGPIDPAWWPRCEDRLRVSLGDGAVVCSARLDLVLGGAPTGRPIVILEAKSGPFRQDHRAGLLWYALLAALRHGTPPAAVIGWSALDGTSSLQPITAGVLAAAAERAVAALTRLADLAVGREPTATPGRACAWCPALAGCDVASPTFGVDDD